MAVRAQPTDGLAAAPRGRLYFCATCGQVDTSRSSRAGQLLSAHTILDLLGHGQKGLFHIGRVPCRGLQKGDS